MKHLFTFAFTALVALMSLAPNTATAQATEPIDTIELRFKSFYSEDQPFFQAADTSIARLTGDTLITPANWTITLKNERYSFDFIIFNTNDQDPSGTYTEKDLDISFSKVMIPEANGHTSYIKTCNIVIKKEQVSASYFKYILDAELISTLGIGGEVNGAFKLHAEQKVVEPSAKYDVAILDCQVTENDNRVRLTGKNDTMDVDMTFLTTEGVIGYYTHKQLETGKTTFKHRGVAYGVMELEGMIVSADTKDGGIAYVAMMEILANSDKDTTFFNVAMEAPVKPTETINITCNNLIVDPSQAATDLIQITGSNNTYSIYAGYNDRTVKDSAHYDGINALIYITELATEKTITALQSSITIVGSKAKGYNVTMTALGNDYKQYNIFLTNILPTKQDIDIQFTSNSKAMYDIDESGLHELQMANTNANYSVAFDILNIDRILLAEEFYREDLFIDESIMATYLVKHTDKGDVDIEMLQVHGSIKQKNDSTFLNATILGLDSTRYKVSMFYTVPTPIDTVECTFSEDLTEFENALPQGIFILGALTDDGQIMCNIQVNRIATGTIEGTFICDGQFEENQFEPFETYVGTLKDASKMEFDAHYMQQGELTASIDSLGKVHATAKFICDNAVLYILHFNFTYVRPRLPYDTEDGGVNTTIGKEAKVKVYDEYLESDGYIEYLLYVENPFNELDLVFFIDEKDPDIVIPVGVYPFGVYGSKNHVLASRGMVQDNKNNEMYPLPSYYQTLDELGQPHGYFLVDGTVTVEKVDGHIVMYIDAVNSYDLPVKITYDPSKTAVENVENTPSNSIHKQLINGQLLIIRNNEVYTATGVRVK